MIFSLSNSWLSLVMSTGFATKFILVFLLLLTIACLTILINRYVILREHKRHIEGAVAALNNIRTFDDIIALASVLKGSYPGVIVKKATICAIEAIKAREQGCEVNAYQFTQELHMTLEQTVLDLSQDLDEYLPVLSISAASSPLIGLLGTVLGLINSFVAISKLHMATIVVVAPGIAEALITTFAGVFVAVLSLFAYQYIQSQVRSVERQLFSFSDIIEQLIKKVIIS